MAILSARGINAFDNVASAFCAQRTRIVHKTDLWARDSRAAKALAALRGKFGRKLASGVANHTVEWEDAPHGAALMQRRLLDEEVWDAPRRAIATYKARCGGCCHTNRCPGV